MSREKEPLHVAHLPHVWVLLLAQHRHYYKGPLSLCLIQITSTGIFSWRSDMRFPTNLNAPPWDRYCRVICRHRYRRHCHRRQLDHRQQQLYSCIITL